MDSTRLIPCNIQAGDKWKWLDFVDGGNGFLYGIPFYAKRVVYFNPDDKSIKAIGPDLGGGYGKYCSGIRADNGSIYCVPNGTQYFLKITPMMGKGGDCKIEILKDRKLPWNGINLWRVGALAKDGCIYYLPYSGKHILKLDTVNNDTVSLVKIDLGHKRYEGAVLGTDGCIYGMPCIGATGIFNAGIHIMKFNPVDKSICNVGGKLDPEIRFEGGLVAAEDGNIYGASVAGQIIQIDPISNKFSIIGNKMYGGDNGWGPPVIGEDKCIYFAPNNHDRILKYNPSTQTISFVGDSFKDKRRKWYGAVSASDGFIYCVPCNDSKILQIDARHINEKILEVLENLGLIQH